MTTQETTSEAESPFEKSKSHFSECMVPRIKLAVIRKKNDETVLARM